MRHVQGDPDRDDCPDAPIPARFTPSNGSRGERGLLRRVSQFDRSEVDEVAQRPFVSGLYGVRGVGYDVNYLTHQISRAMGLTQNWAVVLIGIGNLGQALAGYDGFSSRGFQIKALLDADPQKIGSIVGGQSVLHIDQLERVFSENANSIAVLAVPESVAQGICDRVVGAGVTSILNFAPTVLQVPSSVELRKVDLSIELQILAFYEQRKLANSSALANPA